MACKPGSVWLRPKPERGSHSSGTGLAPGLVQPTRITGPETGWTARAIHVIPIRSCSRWGLPCRPCCHGRGGLLPHPFTLTFRRRRFAFCGTFPGVAPAGRYPAPCFRGARTFLTPRPFGACGARLPGQLVRAYVVEADGDGQCKSSGGFAAPPTRLEAPLPTVTVARSGSGLRGDPAGRGPCRNSAWKSGSCGWQRGRRCTSGSCHRWCRRRGHAPWRGISSRT